MRFCDICGNMLIPRNGKLYCKACDDEFDLDSEKRNEYKIRIHIKHDDKEIAPIIVKERLKGNKISDQDRKAYEEFFTGGTGDAGY